VTFVVTVQCFGFSETVDSAVLRVDFQNSIALAFSLLEKDAGNGKPLQILHHTPLKMVMARALQ
jgi:hypothetical protein